MSDSGMGMIGVVAVFVISTLLLTAIAHASLGSAMFISLLLALIIAAGAGV